MRGPREHSGPVVVSTPRLQMLRRVYALLAYMTFNCILAFVALNVVLGGLFFVWDRAKASSGTDGRVSAYREKFTDYQAYSRTRPSDVTALLDEQDAMGRVGLQYEPWVQFRNPKVSGRLLNTDDRGFRATRQPQPHPGEPVKIYVFGGSTTFGYGVPDGETIPSYLQKILETKHPNVPIMVRNLGQAYYYSSQEQLVLFSLLKTGDMPHWAIFIDGGNDTAQLALRHDEPIFTPAVKGMWSGPASGDSFIWRLPGRLVQAIARRIGRDANESTSAAADQHRLIHSDANLSETERAQIAGYVVSHYLANLRITRATCLEFGVHCLFVWQPHPAYKYDRRLHKTFPFEGQVPEYFTRVYARLENHRATDFLFLGDLTDTRTAKSYVDDVHYNEAINEQIAERIVLRVDRQGVMSTGRTSRNRAMEN